MRTLFTSDLHLGHENIIKYCKRPFKTVDEMDEALIRNWNSVVGQDDDIWNLGDVSLGPRSVTNYLARLNGRHHLIIGNHEKKALSAIGRFASVHDIATVTVENQRIVLFHYAMRVWNKSHHGAWHLYGHSHGSLPDDPNSLSLDIGVDCWNYTPVCMAQIRQAMAKKTWKPIDHHGDPSRPDNDTSLTSQEK